MNNRVDGRIRGVSQSDGAMERCRLFWYMDEKLGGEREGTVGDKRGRKMKENDKHRCMVLPIQYSPIRAQEGWTNRISVFLVY